ncbi:MAG TPA: DUF2461 domain-containing protein [Candidatus Dormibacteraeota bacterium]|nr:DUF2461 domain-containing protein [Candidatus Dormibacteraeota bacterium]
MATTEAIFPPELFDFLRELRSNNDREWFQGNRARYDSTVRAPALRFVEAVGPRLATLSPHLVADARPVGGSLFRINRDIRFSADKSPYKTAVGMSFGHDAGRERPAPGLYLHLEPEQSFAGGGVHMPDAGALSRIRDAITAQTAEWSSIVGDARFGPMYENTGETLKRVPRGYDPSHPFEADLRRKGHTWHVRFSEAEVCDPAFLDTYVDACAAATPFHRFLAEALGVPW